MKTIFADGVEWTPEKLDEYIRDLRVHSRKLETENQKLRDMLSRYVSLTGIAAAIKSVPLPSLEIVPSLCAFCGDETGKQASIMTSGDDYVCPECHQEFEDALNSGDTE